MATFLRSAFLIGFAGILAAQEPAKPASDAPSEKTIMRMAKDIQRGILTSSNYGVFDWITFGINGYNVVLKGKASRPTLKDSAERIAKQAEGVAAVDNRIEVLPLSPMDDRIRAQAYARIYGSPSLSRYNPNRGTPVFLSPARIAGGITNDPPIGFHPIHIIVQNGSITLQGVVDTSGDKAIAGMMANQVPGSFAVENELVVANADQQKDAKTKKK